MLPTNNIKILEIVDPNRPVITPSLRRDLIKKRVVNMVKTVQTLSVSTWAAPVLLMILLGYGVYSSHQAEIKANEMAIQMQSLHDSLIRLQTQKEEQDKQMDRDRHDQMVANDKEATWREVMNNKINALTPIQVRIGKNNHTN